MDEPILDTAVRESREEIGAEIEKDKLEFAASYLRWKVIVNLFFYNWSKNEDNFHFDDGEVEEVKWVKYSLKIQTVILIATSLILLFGLAIGY